jgi:hypothetical protein
MQKFVDCKEIDQALTPPGIATCPENTLPNVQFGSAYSAYRRACLLVIAQHIYHKGERETTASL